MTHKAIWIMTAVVAGGVIALLTQPGRPTHVHAMTAHGTENKTMATLPLEAGLEAVVVLDHITCDLTGYVLDRFSGKFFMQYRYNLAGDFDIRQGKLPRFSLVTGQADFRQFSGNERIANGVIYVSEDNSGQMVAYGMPWNTQFRTNTVSPQFRSFVPLDYAQTRFLDANQIR